MLKITAQPEKRDIFVKNGNESRDVLGDSRKRYRCLREEIGKLGPHRQPIRLPSEKKQKTHTVCAMNIYEVFIRTVVMVSFAGRFYADFMRR